ncbi:SDR family oxidoreductase [Rhodococcus opacus]|nr:SDR family NAD(P)-dependent oxidoreductase [Rhodococcus opacus]MDV6246719.1 SDR family oxidoreductase [Rhodococcus opacus]
MAAEIGAERSIVFDATSEKAVNDAVAQVADDGSLDILLCSHGILTQSSAVDMPVDQWRETIDIDQWRETIDIDLISVLLPNRTALRPMLAQESVRIINVASQLGIKGVVSLAHYAAAKAGVIAMTKSIALETAAKGVLVHAIAPGPIQTPMVADIDDDWKRAKRAQLPLTAGSDCQRRSLPQRCCAPRIRGEICSSDRSSAPTRAT